MWLQSPKVNYDYCTLILIHWSPKYFENYSSKKISLVIFKGNQLENEGFLISKDTNSTRKLVDIGDGQNPHNNTQVEMFAIYIDYRSKVKY